MFAIPEHQTWLVIAAFLFAFLLAFAMGANDVANSFGTSVGSGVLTLRQACVLATIFETSGSILLGAKVSETIRTGMLQLDLFTGMDVNGTRTGSELMMLGQFSSLVGTGAWLLIATGFGLPVSSSHSIVGSIVGFALVCAGAAAVNWKKLLFVVASWFISPIVSGLLSVILYFLLKTFVLEKLDPLEPGLRVLPVIYSITIAINVFSIVYDGPALLKFNQLPLWATLLITFTTAAITSLLVKFLLVPKQRNMILKEFESNSKYKTIKTKIAHNSSDSNKCFNESNKQKSLESTTTTATTDKPEQCIIFSWLQILTAVFGSFAHGGNDVSNSIGPLIGLWIIATTGFIGDKVDTPVYILLFGGVGISVGLWVLGRRVIQTMGEDLTSITPSSGFCIELGAAIAVLLASNLGLPVSSTHCKVGSVVLVGHFRSRDSVQWQVFRNIAIAWVVTVPASAAISAAVMILLRAVML